MEEFHSKKSVFAFLCKTIVARNIMKYCWSNAIYYKEAFLYPINAKKYFSAAVDACFFIVDFTTKRELQECNVYDSIEDRNYKNKLGFYNNRLIVDIDKFQTQLFW